MNRHLSLLLLLAMLLPATHALVIDDARVLPQESINAIEQFNAKSSIQFSLMTAASTYDIEQQALDNFHSYHLQFLVFYVKQPSSILVIQPVHEGIPSHIVSEILDKHRNNLPAALSLVSTELMQAMPLWERAYTQKPSCALLKDGYCDASCEERDLDCYCGDDECQTFENSVTCAQDCGEYAPMAFCGLIRDTQCDRTCPLSDPDCPIDVAAPPAQQSTDTPFLYVVLLIGILIVGAAVFRYYRVKQ